MHTNIPLKILFDIEVFAIARMPSPSSLVMSRASGVALAVLLLIAAAAPAAAQDAPAGRMFAADGCRERVPDKVRLAWLAMLGSERRADEWEAAVSSLDSYHKGSVKTARSRANRPNET
jgi:hypothetical protein